MAIELVVVTPFGGHRKGDVISDAAEIEKVLADSRSAHVVKVTAPEKEAAQ